MAPEVMQYKPHNEKADIYSLGMVLYEMVTNQVPFDGLNQMQLLCSIINKERPPVDGILPEWKFIITQCWDDDPNRRPSATEVLKMIEKL